MTRPDDPLFRAMCRRHWPILLAFFAVPVLIELVLSAADFGLVATPRLRLTAYQNGAFWAGLLDNWRPNYRVQPVTMFVTYSFLHAGLVHLGGNVLALLLLIRLTEHDLSGWRFLAVYVISAIGGALGFALLGTALNPMVGASGALFGLSGAWRWLEWRATSNARSRVRMVLKDTALLVILNALMWVLQSGSLAWEAHIGGFAAGIVAMAVLPRRAQ